MAGTFAYSAGERLGWLAQRLGRVERPYLITGPQAAYEYHHWLAPLENLATIQVYAGDVPAWQEIASDGCAVFEAPPTAAQVRAMREAVILDPTMEPERYRRRRVIDGLAFVAAEDLCLDLVERARGETSPAEASAILLARRDSLAWDVLLDQASQRGLARLLGALIEATNVELGVDIAPVEFIRQLHRLAAAERASHAGRGYPSGRRQTIPAEYSSLAERWGIRWLLPRHVIGKVVFDLQPLRS